MITCVELGCSVSIQVSRFGLFVSRDQVRYAVEIEVDPEVVTRSRDAPYFERGGGERVTEPRYLPGGNVNRVCLVMTTTRIKFNLAITYFAIHFIGACILVSDFVLKV